MATEIDGGQERDEIATPGNPIARGAGNSEVSLPDIDVQTLKDDRGLYVYVAVVSLMQNARLTRKVGLASTTSEGALLDVPTWSRRILGSVGAKNLRDIRDSIGDLVDEFINDWLAVN